jgi:hypothetical protein
MDEIFNLLLGAVPAMFFVFVIVEGLKTYGFVNEESWLTAPRAGLSTGLVLAVVALLEAFVPETAPYINTAAPLVFGGLIAGLFYELAGEALKKRVAAVVAAVLGK